MAKLSKRIHAFQDKVEKGKYYSFMPLTKKRIAQKIFNGKPSKNIINNDETKSNIWLNCFKLFDFLQKYNEPL